MIISPPVDITAVMKNISQNTFVRSISRGVTSFADAMTGAGGSFSSVPGIRIARRQCAE